MLEIKNVSSCKVSLLLEYTSKCEQNYLKEWNVVFLEMENGTLDGMISDLQLCTNITW